MSRTIHKILASAITLTILGLIVYAGPAQAFAINLDFDDTQAEQGKTLRFTASVDMNGNENLPVDELHLILSGPESVDCAFDATGKMKAGVNDACHGINIKRIAISKTGEEYGYGYGDYNGHGYDFGYGYGYTGKLEYEITIHTQKFMPGDYDTEFKIVVNDKEFSQAGQKISILQKEKGKDKVNIGSVKDKKDNKKDGEAFSVLGKLKKIIDNYMSNIKGKKK